MSNVLESGHSLCPELNQVTPRSPFQPKLFYNKHEMQLGWTSST